MEVRRVWENEAEFDEIMDVEAEYDEDSEEWFKVIRKEGFIKKQVRYYRSLSAVEWLVVVYFYISLLQLISNHTN